MNIGSMSNTPVWIDDAFKFGTICSKKLLLKRRSMTSEILQQLEQLLGNPLPLNYLQLLNSYPEALVNVKRALDDSDSEGTVAEMELIADLQLVLDINREARSESISDPDGMEFFWPEYLLVIGETGSGDYYCIDVEGDVDEVIQFDHQEVDFGVVADSLDDYVEMLFETFADAASSENDDSETSN